MQLLIPRSVRWSGGPEADRKLSGDIGLTRSAKESNHCCTNTLHEPSGDIGLTRSAKESNHCCTITVTVRTRVVGLCLESVDATALTAVSVMTKAKTILQEGHALQGKITQKVWRRAGFFSLQFLHKDLNQNDHGDNIDLVQRKNKIQLVENLWVPTKQVWL